MINHSCGLCRKQAQETYLGRFFCISHARMVQAIARIIRRKKDVSV